MQTPFTFGEIAEDYFVNRQEELAQLKANLKSLTSTILISPRRIGKTSLVHKASASIATRKHKVCHINMQRIRDERTFYEVYTREVLKTMATRTQNALQIAKEGLSRVSPRFTLGTAGIADFAVSLQLDDIRRSADEILDLPELLAKKRQIKLTICIDEFQQLLRFENATDFQHSLRASWQHHKSVGYCLYGSQKSLMSSIFQDYKNPFYQFGDVMFLDKIGAQHWIPFIMHAFQRTKKRIKEEDAQRICTLMDNHSHYVQYLSHLVWIRTKTSANTDLIYNALGDLFRQHVLYFEDIMRDLATKQINYLHALSAGEKNPSSAEVIVRYDLGASSTATKSKQALMQKEILDQQGGTITFVNPVFALWLKDVYFNEQVRM